MSQSIKFNAFHVLFRLFAYLADKSGGWQVFVRPKMLIGSLILGLGLTTSENVEAQNQSSKVKKKEFPKDNKVTIQSKEIEDKVYCYVTEQMPQYPGGESELLNFVYKNLKYPESASKNKIQGKVIVRFVITESGEVEKIEVVRSLQVECDKEAIRVIKLLPKFIPGKQNGKTTNVWYTLPVTYKLENNHDQKN